MIDEFSLPSKALNRATRQAILDIAVGNPLALRELPRNAEQIDSWSPAMPMTDRLVAVFGSRLRRLDAPVRTELLRAALDGTPAAQAGDSGSRYVMNDVESAIEQDLLTVTASGDTVFRHPLVRSAVIHQAAPAERRAAHAHLARLYDYVLVRRATHMSAAAIGPDQAVADLLYQAANRRSGVVER